MVGVLDSLNYVIRFVLKALEARGSFRPSCVYAWTETVLIIPGKHATPKRAPSRF